MIHVTPGIVLGRRRYKEFDRLAMVFTRDFGRLRVRYIGVDRPQAKLRAFTEPFVRADYRLYLRGGSEVATGIGGQIAGVFPAIRADYQRTNEALYCCEMVLRLTPEHQPSAEEYDLLAGALEALDRRPNPWITLAFGLRLLKLTGFGLVDIKPPTILKDSWDRLHMDTWQQLETLPFDATQHRTAVGHMSLHIRDRVGQRIESERFVFHLPETQVVQ